MPLNQPALALEAGPRSVQDARRWATDACRALKRDELIPSAESGISELVTNALLHGQPPICVRVRGTREHPRIEVIDSSPKPPAPNPRMTDEDELLSTIGRGLGLVAMSSHAWGADRQADGKIVWFEPRADVNEAPDFAGDVFGFGTPPGLDLASGAEGGLLDVHFENLPLALYVDFRRHFRELSRELRLLSLAHESEYPVAKDLSDLFLRFEEEQHAAIGSVELQHEIDAGSRQAQIRMVVPRDAPATMAQMISLLELADAFCREQRLLSLATTPQQQHFQRWYLGEYVRQARGEDPLPWAGSDRADGYPSDA
ncbi:ATP-binding protein [Nocardioides donggukensis]|uniref:ATP-binding protein n=1 Tax=Nocardioides donggukensis TaxID=2774019 RepID=A0A927Q109_9ACTN|nr:ATP-binding protein [Nocardioides donggukensis]MBD8868291.1 ATP-binding protein [Nocardioides donggukensis]